jgi:uncharacterized protein with HEPN domain
MRPELRDASYLWDIVDAARTALDATRGLTLEEYERSPVLRLAAERCIEILGEAASRVSAGFRQAHPEIPWQKMVSQRNVLAHEYRDIRHGKIWRLLQEHLPRLVEQIEPLLPPPPAGE